MELVIVSVVGWVGIIAVMIVQQRNWSKERTDMLNRIQAPELAITESIDAPPARVTVMDEQREHELQEEGRNGRS